MLGLLLSLTLLLQGVPIQPQQGGTVSGILRDATGKPASGIRIAATTVPESPVEAQNSTALASIAETDETGRYRLENIPPGRYYISAGRLDLPTYYPGTQDMSKGTVVAVAAGSSAQIDFTLQATSAGRAIGLGGVSVPTASLPIDVRVSDGEKVPLYGPNGFVSVLLQPMGTGVPASFLLDIHLVTIPGPGPLNYKVTLSNLPEDYTLKSMTYDSVELNMGIVHLPASSFGAGTLTFFSGFSPVLAGLVPPLAPIAINPPSAASFGGATPLVLTLNRSAAPTAGVRVRGKITGPATRSIYISGKPGIVFTDGTFEFQGVPSGRHAIYTLNGAPLAASVVVGDADVDGIELESTPSLPLGTLTTDKPEPAGVHKPGVIALGSMRGKVLDRDTREPLPTGMVFLTGGAYGTSLALQDDGSFEFARLLPGTYNVEIQPFDHETIKRVVVVGDDGANVQVETTPNR